MMVGVPPYSPGDYINVSYEDDTVDLWLAPYFTRPLQLSAAEGLALLAGGRALLAVDGSDPDGPLATAVEKLERALGVTEVVVDVTAPPFLDDIRRAAADGRRVEIDYWSGGRDELSTAIDRSRPAVLRARGVVHRRVLLAARGAAHVPRRPRSARCARPTITFEPVTSGPAGHVYHPRPDDPRVTLELPRGASWVAESAPSESVEDLDDGRQRVTIAVSEPAWLERILLQVGPQAVVTDPPDWHDLGARAAARGPRPLRRRRRATRAEETPEPK